MELGRCWHSLRPLKHSPCRHRLKGAGLEQDSRGHGDWIEVTRLASDSGKSLQSGVGVLAVVRVESTARA